MIEHCRICKSKELKEVLNLGEQYLTGVFPKNKRETQSKGLLSLVLCRSCELLQLGETFDLEEMYGENYGYRSGLNKSMVDHLTKKINKLERLIKLQNSDLVIDIGSNDSTALQQYKANVTKVGIDPSGLKFKKFYPRDIVLIPEFFNYKSFNDNFKNKQAKIITSIAMFYDLEEPLEFVKDISKCLEQEGIWHFEQSYLPTMLRTNAFDTVCHEHLEFYSLTVIKNILEMCDMRIIDVEMNDINGGSFAVTACKQDASYKSNNEVINWIIDGEKNLNDLKTYAQFADNIIEQSERLISLLNSLKKAGKTVLGYGASTKGNVLLQYYNITSDLLPFIAEVNEDKFGAFTPGTNIPIISEKEARKMNPDYYLVLPWHFKENILNKEEDYREKGGKFIFPLPYAEIV